MERIKQKITTQWFFSNPTPILKLLGIYVKGDGLVLIPFLIVLLLIYIFSIKFGLIVTGIYMSLRGAGEMIYWLFQQFGPKTYRPWDYGLKQLNNEAIYIIYQLTSMLQVIAGLAFIFYVVMYI